MAYIRGAFFTMSLFLLIQLQLRTLDLRINHIVLVII